MKTREFPCAVPTWRVAEMTGDNLPPGVITANTATRLPPETVGGRVVICGSHGGRYPGYLAARAGVRAIILCDAGIGKDEAGVAGLAYLETLGIAAAAVSSWSCRIGDPLDMLRRGGVSRANALARAVGVFEEQGCREAAECLTAVPLQQAVSPSPIGESRQVIEGDSRRIVLIDSAADVRAEDAGQIIVTGSHGGLVGGEPAKALQVDGFAGVFNDAGIGMERAGLARLPALDQRDIAAFTVAASSARIGEACSTYEDGVISAVNERAAENGAKEGMSARQVIESWL